MQLDFKDEGVLKQEDLEIRDFDSKAKKMIKLDYLHLGLKINIIVILDSKNETAQRYIKLKTLDTKIT